MNTELEPDRGNDNDDSDSDIDIASSQISQPYSAIPHDSRASALKRKRSLSFPLPQKSMDAEKKRTPKPRASRACEECRKRKVRCNYDILIQQGISTCSNCSMDGVECFIPESKRQKKSSLDPPTSLPRSRPHSTQLQHPHQYQHQDLYQYLNLRLNQTQTSIRSGNLKGDDVHEPHALYQRQQRQINTSVCRPPSHDQISRMCEQVSLHGDRSRTKITELTASMSQLSNSQLPAYIKVSAREIDPDDLEYLLKKGTFMIPQDDIRNALLHSYVEFVHPFMPLLDIHEFFHIINQGDGKDGRISFLLFQSIMFVASAFVHLDYLKQAGFSDRKEARRAFFQRARALHDFDYEQDRISQVQSLLLMSYWYEGPSDQKDTWHWMGLAIQVAHTVGLHRNPENLVLSMRKKKLWKRMWWCCFMRDRLIAVGMRRPLRIVNEDPKVPMLTEDDFVIEKLSESNLLLPSDSILRDDTAQYHLAQLCIAKVKLTLCLGHVLSAQYSAFICHNGDDGVQLQFKGTAEKNEVQRYDFELDRWLSALPPSCLYSSDIPQGSGSVFFHQALLHMFYYTTVSALHRPQVLPSNHNKPKPAQELHCLSNTKVQYASRRIAEISEILTRHGLEKYLPTSGVTIMLPAMTIQLLNMVDRDKQRAADEDFTKCMRVLETLREIYSSAHYAQHFLELVRQTAKAQATMLNSNSTCEEVQILKPLSPPLTDQAPSASTSPAANLQRALAGPSITAPDANTVTWGHPIDSNDFMNQFIDFEAMNDGSWPHQDVLFGESGTISSDLQWHERDPRRNSASFHIDLFQILPD